MLAQGEAMELVDARKPTSLAADGLSGIVKRSDVSFHVVRAHLIEAVDALLGEPITVLAQIGAVCGYRGLRQTPFHVDMREELSDQPIDAVHQSLPIYGSCHSHPSKPRWLFDALYVRTPGPTRGRGFLHR